MLRVLKIQERTKWTNLPALRGGLHCVRAMDEKIGDLVDGTKHEGDKRKAGQELFTGAGIVGQLQRERRPGRQQGFCPFSSPRTVLDRGLLEAPDYLVPSRDESKTSHPPEHGIHGPPLGAPIPILPRPEIRHFF